MIAENDDKMWFGTVDHSLYIPAPLSGADVSPNAWSESGTGLNGTGYGMHSFNSHKEYVFDWSRTETRRVAQMMKSFFDGSFGRGKIYFQDPLTYTTNVLPARWADPSITCDFEGPQLVPGVDPTPVITSGFEPLTLPVRSAQFPLTGVSPMVNSEFVAEATNYFTNPGLVGSGVWQELARNYFTNPDLVGDGTWAEVARNRLIPAPFGITTVNGQLQVLVNAASYSGGYLSVTPGERISLTTVGRNSNRFYYGFSSTAPVNGTPLFAAVNAGNAATERRDILVPEGATHLVIYLALGDTGVRGFATATSPSDFRWLFDGSTPARSIDPDMRQRWLGAENASVSVMEIERVRGFSSSNCIVGVSQRDGKPAARMIPTTVGNGSSFAWFDVPQAVRASGTVAGTLHLDGPLQPPFNNAGVRTIDATDPRQPSDTAPNESGAHPLRAVFSSLTSGYRARIWNGSAQGGGDVWWTDIGLYAGDYRGPHISGGAPDRSIDPDMRTRFLGAANASESVIEGELVRDMSPAIASWTAVAIASSLGGRNAARVITLRDGTTPRDRFNIPTGSIRESGTWVATAYNPNATTGYAGLGVGDPLRRSPSAAPGETTRIVHRWGGSSGNPSLTASNNAYLYGTGVIWESVWFVDVGLYTGEYDGPDFDGDSQIPGKVTRWTGAPGASTSEIGVIRATTQPRLTSENAVFIPIPDGMQLNLGAFYESDTEQAGIYVSRATRGGMATTDLIRLAPLTPNEQPNNARLFPNVIARSQGTIGAYLWIGKTASVSATLLIRAIHARLSPIGEVPGGDPAWIGGQGNAGTRFTRPPTYIDHTGVDGGQVEFAASFIESVL